MTLPPPPIQRHCRFRTSRCEWPSATRTRRRPALRPNTGLLAMPYRQRSVGHSIGRLTTELNRVAARSSAWPLRHRYSHSGRRPCQMAYTSFAESSGQFPQLSLKRRLILLSSSAGTAERQALMGSHLAVRGPVGPSIHRFRRSLRNGQSGWNRIDRGNRFLAWVDGRWYSRLGIHSAAITCFPTPSCAWSTNSPLAMTASGWPRSLSHPGHQPNLVTTLIEPRNEV